MTDVWSAPVVSGTVRQGKVDAPHLGMVVEVWTAPRRVVQAVVRDGSRYGVLPLAAVAGIASINVRGQVDPSWLSGFLAVAMVAAPVFGALGLFVEALSVYAGASLLGERASLEDLAVALAWGRVPATAGALPVTALALAIPLLSLSGDWVPWLGLALAAWQVLGWGWSWFTTGHGLGEVLGVSAGRATAAYLIVPLGLALVLSALLALAFLA